MFGIATSEHVYFVGITHFVSLLLMVFLARSGIEILSACPKLWWNDDCAEGREWLRLTRRTPPKGRLGTTLEEEEDWSPWVSLPGHRNLGLGRQWHALAVGLWLVNGLVYYVLLAVSGEWRRLIPTSWRIFPDALSAAWTYLHFELPPPGNPYNPLQQLSYAAVVFLFPAFMIATGVALSPGVEARFPWYVRLFRGRQVARSLHFLGLVAIAGFAAVHVALVLIEGFAGNVSYIMFGVRDGDPGLAIGLLVAWLVLIAAVQVLATWATLRWRRGAQRALTAVVTPVRRAIFEKLPSRQDWSSREVTPVLRVNGSPPDTEEFLALQDESFRHYRLRVSGLVETPLELSLGDLRALPSREQTTLHNCIEGWSGIARWKGVPVKEILALARPTGEARFAIFHSFQWVMGHPFYESLELDLLEGSQALLAYEMNGAALPLEHGAPLRLRVENLLGFKMVKYLREIEFAPSYEHAGLGMGGHREDHRYYGTDAGI